MHHPLKECILMKHFHCLLCCGLKISNTNREKNKVHAGFSSKRVDNSPLSQPHSPAAAAAAVNSYISSCFMTGKLTNCFHLAWTQASGAWSIHCSTWVKVMQSSPSLLCSPMSKHMVTEHLEHVLVTIATWPELEQQRRRNWKRFQKSTLLKQSKAMRS